MDIGASASEMADWGGAFPFSESGLEGVLKLQADHTHQPPRDRVLERRVQSLLEPDLGGKWFSLWP